MRISGQALRSGTHPGSGLPTIYESGRIAANMIARKYGVVFESANRMV